MITEPPTPPEGARRLFGQRLPRAQTFASVLADTGVSHGLIGPREVDILWDRHILNCAVVEDSFPQGARVIDVGAGAGLPGLALAIARPDLDLHLVEPMQRRTEWLETAVEEIGLDNVTVLRGRAEEYHGALSAPFVTARAVARLDKLARWCFPLITSEGWLIAIKGRSAAEELTATTPALRKLGMVSSSVTEHGAGITEEPTRTVDCHVRTSARHTRRSR